jgi:hypothetical protein
LEFASSFQDAPVSILKIAIRLGMNLYRLTPNRKMLELPAGGGPSFKVHGRLDGRQSCKVSKLPDVTL